MTLLLITLCFRSNHHKKYLSINNIFKFNISNLFVYRSGCQKSLQWSGEAISYFDFRIYLTAKLNQRGLAECLNPNYRPPIMPQLLGDKNTVILATLFQLSAHKLRIFLRHRPSHSLLSTLISISIIKATLFETSISCTCQQMLLELFILFPMVTTHEMEFQVVIII